MWKKAYLPDRDYRMCSKYVEGGNATWWRVKKVWHICRRRQGYLMVITEGVADMWKKARVFDGDFGRCRGYVEEVKGT